MGFKAALKVRNSGWLVDTAERSWAAGAAAGARQWRKPVQGGGQMSGTQGR